MNIAAEWAEVPDKAYKDAIERMGPFGRMFVVYKGDPRGPIGQRGFTTNTNDEVVRSVLWQSTVVDVDGNVWRPVLERDLEELISRVPIHEKMSTQKKWIIEAAVELEVALARVKNVTFWDTNEPDTDFYTLIEKALSDGIEMLKELRGTT